MPVEEAKYHMKRCVDSGLWVPNAADLNQESGEDSTEINSEDKKSQSKENPLYTGVSSEDLD